MIITIIVGEKNLGELIEDVNGDEITRQLKVAEIRTKSIPGKNICGEIPSF